jgi:hypothetical protein
MNNNNNNKKVRLELRKLKGRRILRLKTAWAT